LEWDQFIFYQGHKLWKTLRKRLTPTNPYFPYQISYEEVRIIKFLLTLRSQQTLLLLGGDKIILGNNFLKFPETVHLYPKEKDTKKMIRIHIAYLCFLFEQKKTNNYSNTFYKSFRNFLKEFPGILSDWKELRENRLPIRKNDPVHYTEITKYFLHALSTIEESKESILTGKDFNSEKQKQKINSKESKQKLDLNDAELLEVDEKKIEEYTLGHNFEKIETVEEFDGQWRDIDGEEDMEEEEALQELNLKHIIRTENPVHSTRSNDAGVGTQLEIAEHIVQTSKFEYPEWDFKSKEYRPHYCSVIEEFPQATNLFYSESILEKQVATLKRLKKKMFTLINQTRIKKRLSSGADIDLDALISRYADLKAKISPSESIYMNPVRDVSDMVLYFLVDLSLSTDSWVHEKRIFDVERESLLLFSDCLEEIKIPFGIAGFYSRTRKYNQYLNIKTLTEPWSVAKDRLGALSPIGYTRVGPALRHTASILKNTCFRQKWIILMTDARPNDYDKYEGKYGIEDVNKAVVECSLDGIKVYTLAIGTEEKPTIPAMMRNASYQMLFHPENLLDSLQEFFRRAIQ